MTRRSTQMEKLLTTFLRRGKTIFLTCLAVLFAATPVSADFKICNPTDHIVAAAIGYSDGQEWHSEGWWAVKPQDCEVILHGPLTARFYYVFARTQDGRIRWDGKSTLCTDRRAFVIQGREKCTKRGYQETGFREVDTGEAKNWDLILGTP